MTTRREWLEVEIGKLQALLSAPRSPIFGDGGLGGRLKQLEAELAGLEHLVSRPVSVSLTFRGDPVIGSRGIEAGFGGEAVRAFAMLAAADAPSDERKLFITGAAHGSFGFIVEEIGQQSIEESLLAESTRKSIDALHALIDDQTLDGFDGASLGPLNKFLDILSKQKVWVNVSTPDRKISMTPETVARAKELASRIKSTEETQTLTATLEGVLPGKRTFELRTDIGEERFGKIDPKLPIETVEAHLKKRVEVTLLLTTIEYPSGYTRREWQLRALRRPDQN